jgi:mannosyltransferase OCH1-like enzyme
MIPKTIFQTWKTQNLPKKVSRLHSKMLRLNPEYQHIIYTDSQMDDYMYSNTDGDLKKVYFKLNNIVAKADLWRYTVLLNEGGVYLDIDSEIVKPLSKLITPNDSAIITAERNQNLFVQWALIFEKNHPILSRTLEYIIQAVHQEKFKNDHHSLTVKTYASAVFDLGEESSCSVVWEDITNNTNTVHKLESSSFRMFGIDYNEYFRFQHKYNHELRGRKKGEVSNNHWTKEQKTKNLY